MTRFLSTLAILLLSLPLFGQEGRPYAFFSTSDKEPAAGPPQKVAPALRLRPNNELPYFAYVRNPGTDEWTKLTVILAADAKGENVLAEGSVAKIAAGETIKVKLTAKAPAVVEKPVEKKDDTKKDDAKPVVPVTTPLPETVYILLAHPTDDNPRALITSASAKPLVSVRIASPKEYLDVSTATPAGVTASNNDLYVQIGDKDTANPFRGKPCKVMLNIRPDLLEGLDSTVPKEGTFEAVVAPGAEKIVLVAKNLKFNGEFRTGYVSITADGYSHAFVYQVDFRGTSPKPVEEKGFLKIETPRYHLTGKPLLAKLEIFGDDTGGQPRLFFHRTDVGTPESVTAGLTTPRDSKTGFRIGAEGEIIVSAEVKDWMATIDTAGLYGERKLEFKLDKANRTFTAAETRVTFDDTPPAAIEFVKPPEKAIKGKKFTIAAQATDKESGVKSALFFLGEPPAEGKKPAKGTAAVGVLKDGVWTAEFDTPDVKGTFEVGVRFTNPVGLSSEKQMEILAFEVVKPTTGKIEGKVVQGDERAQPGLTVTLFDAEAKKLATATTDKKGVFVFDNLKPGEYTVTSVKEIDYFSKGEQKVKVVAGETAKPEISLKR